MQLFKRCVVSFAVLANAMTAAAHNAKETDTLPSKSQSIEAQMARAHESKTNEQANYWMRIQASTPEERTRLLELGVSIESVTDEDVVGLGDGVILQRVKETGRLLTSFELDGTLTLDFPAKDSNFHNYTELREALESLAATNSDILALSSIGTSIEGRDIFHVRISKDPANASTKPGIAFMGGHHAREHLSIEIPLKLIQHLVKAYRDGDTRVRDLIDNRDIHIIPMVNPDGAEHDIVDGRYAMWRKNRRRNTDGTYGVDLNRNYGFGWGTGGSSRSPRSDVYMGSAPFSEPETQAIRGFVESQSNITVLLSYHTFSELILYPWGHVYDSISDARDRDVHEVMAQTMARWNGYTPQQSSDLYIASGDTTDWSYGEHRIVSFTFELDPKSLWDGGFYPGQAVIPVVFQKNLEPALYLIEHSDNPYRVLEATPSQYGVPSLKFQ